ADGAVRHLGADVEHFVRPVDRVEVFGIVLPTPLDALGQCGARDVLDAFHQADQPRVPVGLDGGEADPAVAHDDGGHTVPAARRQQRIPRHLSVEVRVHVDEAGRHERAVGIDLGTGAAVDLADVRHHTAGDRDI